MLVHDRFVFLHVPKTGGRFVREALSRELPGCHHVPELGSHAGWDKIPKEAAGLPVFGFVRNPWDWYVSWYCFISSRPPRRWVNTQLTNPLASKLFLDPPRVSNDFSSTLATFEISDFTTTVRRACTGIVDGEDPEELQRIVRNADLAGPLLEGYDFYTARLATSFGAGLDSGLLTLCRFESLIDDLEAFLHAIGVEISEDAGRRIRTMEPVGPSKRGDYRDYYDAELRDLVGSSCKTVIDRFEYSFG